MNLEKIAFTPAEAATFTGFTTGVLGNMRSAGTGPKFHRVGKRKILYLREDLLDWIRSSQVSTLRNLTPDSGSKSTGPVSHKEKEAQNV